jgi:xanthine phosphoribosyltransferase
MKNVTYQEVETHCQTIANKIKKEFKDLSETQFCAVSRGGLIPATIIANTLKIRNIYFIRLSSYHEENKKGKIVDNSSDKISNLKPIVIIEDLTDSGDTISYLKKQYPQAKIATLYHKRPNVEVWYKGDYVEASEWIVFPWETVRL